MVDTNKRTTLKTMAVGTTLISAPMIASSIAASSKGISTGQENRPLTGANHTTINGIELEVDAIPDSDSVWIRVSNITDRSVAVRHINPGVLQFDGPKSVYKGNSITIHKDESYSFIVAPMTSTAQAVPVPSLPLTQFTATVNTQGRAATGDVLTPRMVLA